MNHALALPAGMSVATAYHGLRARSCLTARERQECQRLPAHARSDFQVGRLAAKRAVALLLPAARLQEVDLVSGANDAPCARWRGVQLVGSISIAHRDGRAIAAASGPGIQVGVDLERRHAVPRTQGRYFLTDRELQAGIPDASVLWALKEAVWKLLRLNSECPFHTLELDVSGDRLIGASYDGAYLPVSGYVSFQPTGYVAAVVRLA